MSEQLFALFALVFWGIIIFIIVKAVKTSKKRKNLITEEKRRIGYIEKLQVIHCGGLSIPNNSKCELMYFKDKITVNYNNTLYNLPINKINDITNTTNVEIQKHTVSSAGGAIAGAMMFGVVGAMVGGRAKTKDAKKLTYYLILTYEKDNTIEYITFDTGGMIDTAKKIENDFKLNNKRSIKEIEL